MKKLIVFFFLLISLRSEAISFKYLSKLEFTLNDNTVKQGWIWLSDYDFSENKDLINIIKSRPTALTVYKRIFIPKYAKTYLPDSLNTYLKGAFLCVLETEVFQLNIADVKSVKKLKTIEDNKFSWQKITELNPKSLRLLKRQKRLQEYSTGLELVGYSFFCYNKKISKIKLKELGDSYFQKINTSKINEKEIKKLTKKYENQGIVIVHCFGPC